MHGQAPAIKWFREAVDWGLSNVDGLDPSHDPDLSSLMTNPEFGELFTPFHQQIRAVIIGYY